MPPNGRQGSQSSFRADMFRRGLGIVSRRPARVLRTQGRSRVVGDEREQTGPPCCRACDCRRALRACGLASRIRRHASGRARPSLREQPHPQCSARRTAGHRRRCADCSVRISADREGDDRRRFERPVPDHQDRARGGSRDAERPAPLSRKLEDLRKPILQRHRHADPLQRLSDREPNPASGKPGLRRARDVAPDRAQSAAAGRHRLHEPLARHGAARPQQEQRRRFARAVAPKPRSLQRRRSHQDRRRPGRIAPCGGALAARGRRVAIHHVEGGLPPGDRDRARQARAGRPGRQ